MIGVGPYPAVCDEERGVRFALALRSFLRQDPDVLMVGEIRDAETADIALKSALLPLGFWLPRSYAAALGATAALFAVLTKVGV